MSKFLDTSLAIASTNGFPVKTGTWDFLQSANTERFDALVKSLIASTSSNTYATGVMFRLFGCSINASVILGISRITLSAGAIFYNGEVYLVDPAVLNYGGITGNSIDVAIVKTQYIGSGTNADPVQFSGGGAPVNVHNIFKIKFSSLPAASSTSIYFSNTIPLIKDINSYQAPFGPTYINGYIDDINSPIRIRLDGKTVRIRGKNDNSAHGVVSTNEILFTLPVGYRPLQSQRFPVCDEINTKIVMAEVDVTGTVALRGDAIVTGNFGVYFNFSFDID